MIYPANLLITNYCNQNCPFCFASREMSSKTLAREMSLDQYKLVLKKIKRSRYFTAIKLLGGEPTLHSRLFEMIDMAVDEGLQMQIFTNGVMGKERAKKLATYGKKIGYTFNCVTPGFQHNKALRREVILNMQTLGKVSPITTSVTIDPAFRPLDFLQTIDDIITALHSIRIGFSNPIAHSKNWYTFADFPKMGKILTTFMQESRKRGFAGQFTLNCGFTRCMFTQDEYVYLKSQVKEVGWSCFGKESSMDVAVDLTAFHCFPLSEHKRIDLTKTSYTKANEQFIRERMRLWSKLKSEICLRCPFYGFGGEKCPGPCLAFRMNEIQ
jgi:MoaA/NifB/PqqE/SkfB family radical SAM enzyme